MLYGEVTVWLKNIISKTTLWKFRIKDDLESLFLFLLKFEKKNSQVLK